MRTTIEISDNKKLNPNAIVSKSKSNDFSKQWDNLSSELPQNESAISKAEINEEVKAARKERNKVDLTSRQ